MIFAIYFTPKRLNLYNCIERKACKELTKLMVRLAELELIMPDRRQREGPASGAVRERTSARTKTEIDSSVIVVENISQTKTVGKKNTTNFGLSKFKIV